MSSFVLDEDIAKFSREHGFLGWGLVSAKEGTGIEEAASRYRKILCGGQSGLLGEEIGIKISHATGPKKIWYFTRS
jgi:hypothetical protein